MEGFLLITEESIETLREKIIEHRKSTNYDWRNGRNHSDGYRHVEKLLEKHGFPKKWRYSMAKHLFQFYGNQDMFDYWIQHWNEVKRFADIWELYVKDRTQEFKNKSKVIYPTLPAKVQIWLDKKTKEIEGKLKCLEEWKSGNLSYGIQETIDSLEWYPENLALIAKWLDTTVEDYLITKSKNQNIKVLTYWHDTDTNWSESFNNLMPKLNWDCYSWEQNRVVLPVSPEFFQVGSNNTLTPKLDFMTEKQKFLLMRSNPWRQKMVEAFQDKITDVDDYFRYSHHYQLPTSEEMQVQRTIKYGIEKYPLSDELIHKCYGGYGYGFGYTFKDSEEIWKKWRCSCTYKENNFEYDWCPVIGYHTGINKWNWSDNKYEARLQVQEQQKEKKLAKFNKLGLFELHQAAQKDSDAMSVWNEKTGRTVSPTEVASNNRVEFFSKLQWLAQDQRFFRPIAYDVGTHRIFHAGMTQEEKDLAVEIAEMPYFGWYDLRDGTGGWVDFTKDYEAAQKEVHEVLSRADLLIGYNSDYFDSRVLKANGFDLDNYPNIRERYDLMASIYSHHAVPVREKLDTILRQNGLGFKDKGSDRAVAAFHDAQATAMCFLKLTLTGLDYGKTRMITSIAEGINTLREMKSNPQRYQNPLLALLAQFCSEVPYQS